jgi:DNA-directed RNA polymerase subunit RPC12/RpoP
MPRCPNCSYKLVFIERRLRYKCAKCGKLFLRRFIENREFRLWNEQRRDLERQEILLEIKRLEEEGRKRKEFRELNRIGRALRFLFDGPPKPRIILTPEERRIRRKESKRLWGLKNPDKVKAMKQRYLERHREQRYAYLKSWRMANLDKSRLKQRLTYWRGQQAQIAQKELKFNGYPTYLEDSFSTFGLSELLETNRKNSERKTPMVMVEEMAATKAKKSHNPIPSFKWFIHERKEPISSPSF